MNNSDLIMDERIRERVSMPGKPVYKNNHKTWFNTGMFHQPKFYEISPRAFVVYCVLRAHEVRGNVKSDFWKAIKKKYYDNGHIVCALSQRGISDKTGWGRSRVMRGIKELDLLKIVRIDKIDVGNQNDQHLYLLGRTSNTGDDRYFIDEFINS